ncbi:MAG: hypothetical protein HKN43_13035 [Rhodothermales bacterium]|nr:hypothetical protein [Rhodothermales bacterium]
MDSRAEMENLVDIPTPIQNDEAPADELQIVYETVKSFTDAEYERFKSRVRASIFEPLTNLRVELADAHRSILESLESAVTRKSLWQFQRDYREDVEHAVIERLQSFLDKAQPAQVLNDQYDTFLAALSDHTVTFPEIVEVPFDANIFQPHPDDSSGITARKLAKRLSLRSKHMLSTVRSDDVESEPVQSVPVRDLVTYQLKRRVPAAAVDEYKQAHVELASVVSSLERGLSVWFSSVLLVDRKLGRSTGEDQLQDSVSEEDSKLFDRVIEAARKLQDALEDEAATEVVSSHDSMYSYSWELFRLGLEGRGTFLSALPIPVSQLGSPRIVGGAEDAGAEWISWHKQVDDRLTMINSLIDLRDEMLSIEGRMIERIRTATVDSFVSAFGKLASQLEKSRLLVADSGQSIDSVEDLPAYTTLLKSIRKEVLGTTSWLSSLPGFLATDAALDDAGSTSWKELQAFVDKMPQGLVIHPLEENGTVDPRVVSRQIEMRETIRQALHTDLQTRLKEIVQPVKQELVSAWTSAERIESIVTYNIDAAVDEIQTFVAAEDEDDERTIEDVRNTCAELAGDGLQRAQASIEEAEQSVARVTDSFVRKVGDELLNDWTVIHKMIRLSDAAAERWVEVWSRSVQRLESARFVLVEHAKTANHSLRQWIRLGERRARGLIKKGQTVVGVLDQSDEKRAQTVSAFADIAAFKHELPVVYRRLFGFDSLATPTLLEGRSRDLVWVRNFASQWKNDRGGGVAIVIGALGSGRTSFLHVLDQTALKGIKTVSLQFHSRITEEAELVKVLASSLSLTGGSSTLLELEEEMAGTPDRLCVLVDDTEHLFLQTSYGRELFERFMLFVSRNDKKFCWILTIGKPAWRYLSSTNLRKVGFAASRELSSVDRTVYDSIIFSRHRRSGMPVVFEEANTAKNALADQFSRKRSPEEVQKTLRESYFESLRKASGQNIMLALLYWTRSVDFLESGDLLVKPVKPLSFEFLSRYDSGLAFSLRSLMVHKTLSVEEHNTVFNISSDETAFILERLVNDRVICIANADPDEEIEQPERYSPDMRFRVHPLALHPVGQMLSGSNLLH